MKFHHFFLLLIPFFLFAFEPKEAPVRISNLRVEGLTNPEGIDARQPRLSWALEGNERTIQQTAYQILVASSDEKLAANEGDLWDSGKISSNQSIQNAYRGKSLKSRNRCYWKVKIWTNQGESNWSEPQHWSMGQLYQADWKGRWIGFDRSFPWDNEKQFSRLSARYFRKEFSPKKEIRQATAYIIGLGLYELYLNGQKVGDQVLAPAPTDYTQGVKYNTFDVTSLLKSGKNAVGVILGNGRYYTMRQAYKPYKIKTFGYPKLLLNVLMTYTDGSTEWITTDDSWKGTVDGPIRTNNEYDGEEYDATKEMPGWNTAGFDDQKWLKAEFVQEPGGAYEAQMNENMKVMETIKPVSIKPLKTGVYILDFGQNMAGWVRLNVKGKKGDQVKLRFAETLQSSGELFVRNLRDAKVTDVYTLKGNATESWEPRFVYHGFRYVEITGFPGVPRLENFEGRVVYDDIPTTGTFTSSNPTLNQIFKNAYWGIRSNYKGMPVDCPQRNERQPWLGDRSTGAYGESFLFDNSRLYAKWLDDIQQAQKADGSIPDVAPAFWRYYSDNVTWPGTYLMVANMLHRQFGDIESIRKHYPSMQKWMDYMVNQYTKDGLVTKDKYGDWCVPPESKELIHAKDPALNTDGVLLASATYIGLLDLMQNFAQLLGKPEEVRSYQSQAEVMRKAFNQKFLNVETGYYANNTVTANLLPLMYGITPEKQREVIFARIVDKIINQQKSHISTGVIGTQFLMRGLTQNGRPDLAYTLATNRDYPSWGYMIENGATTIWELWNGNTANPEMNSANHVMLLGDLLIWYYEHVAGIKAASPGFQVIEMKPDFPEGLTEVNASYRSGYGTIQSNWKKQKGQLSWDIQVPANSKAIVHFPAKSLDEIRENGKRINAIEAVKVLKKEKDRVIVEIGSGNYQFTVSH